MALFGANKYGGHHGPRPVIPDKRSVVEYSESRSSESYVREQFAAFGIVPGHEHSPTRHELFQHQMGGGYNPFSRFWRSPNDRTGKVDEFSPKHSNGAVNWREKGPPTNKIYRDADRSVPRDYGKHDHFNSSDTDDTDEYDYDDDDDIICNDGVCIRNTKGRANTKNRKDPYNHKPSYGDNNENHRGNGLFAPPYSGPFRTQPRKDPPYETSYVDNNEKPKGNGYSSPRYGVAPQPKKDTYYDTPYADDNEKRKENGYFAPPYRGSVTTQPKQHTSYDDNNGKYKGNGYSSPRYSGPGESQPRNDTYYGPSNGSLRLTGPPPIKTRSDTGRLSKSENNSPVAIAGQQRGFSTSSPRKYEGNPETIDSAEARRRYARDSPRAEVYREETHAGVIDSREAARKYKGVFVPSSRPF